MSAPYRDSDAAVDAVVRIRDEWVADVCKRNDLAPDEVAQCVVVESSAADGVRDYHVEMGGRRLAPPLRVSVVPGPASTVAINVRVEWVEV